MFGGSLIVSTFVVFILANHYVTDNFDGTEATIYSSSIGIANGIIIFIFAEIYKFACIKVADRENHKFESEYENSYIFKRSFFDFVLSYINLGYYAFYLQDFKLLANSFIFIIISKNLLFLFKVSLLDQHFGKSLVLVEETPVQAKVADPSSTAQVQIRILIS